MRIMSDNPLSTPYVIPGMTIRESFERITNDFATGFEPTIFCRDYDGDIRANGQTGFLRHLGIGLLTFDAFARYQRHDETKQVRILAAPSSIGAEAYGLAAVAMNVGLGGNAGFTIDAFDRSENFTRLASIGAYPSEMAEAVARPWQDRIFASAAETGLSYVRADVKSHVRFLEPQSYEDFIPEADYDVVIANYLFQYLNERQAEDVLYAIQDTNARMIVTDRKVHIDIPSEMPYVPITQHEGWKDSPLANSKTVLGYYNVWVHRDSGPAPGGL